MIPELDITNVVLREDNPYSNGVILQFEDGEFLLEREPLIVPKTINDRYYTTMEGEKIHDIAFQAWNNAKFYWAIMDANDIDFPFELPDGTSLIIPDINLVKLNSYGNP
jgi:hypothetical protein